MSVLEQTCRAHHFELQAQRLHCEGKVPGPLYLSLGQEHVPAAVLAGVGYVRSSEKGDVQAADAGREAGQNRPTSWPVFAQHRRHHWALAKGADPIGMFRELLGRADGCDGGWGGSASMTGGLALQVYSGFIGEQAPVAVGWALAADRPCVCVLGDAACEEDYVLGALGHAAMHKAPVLFVVEDNDRSILTPKADRRSWNLPDVCRGFGLECIDPATGDDPKGIVHCVTLLSRSLPALLNARVCRHAWHEGSGSDGAPAWDRFAMMLEEAGDEGKRLDEAARAEMEKAAASAELSTTLASAVLSTTLFSFPVVWSSKPVWTKEAQPT